ncbi:MAG: hypothetical protein GX802_02355 [Clostridiales bacterium]|jgi:hypothetical protein|nr:hypothetical protein [Clostridiales bacterium]
MKKDRLGERLLIIYALNIIDVIYTMYFAMRFGIQIEANEYALKLWNDNPALLIIFKLFGVGFFLILIYLFRKYKAAEFASKILLAIYAVLVLYHIVLLLLAIQNHGLV